MENFQTKLGVFIHLFSLSKYACKSLSGKAFFLAQTTLKRCLRFDRLLYIFAHQLQASLFLFRPAVHKLSLSARTPHAESRRSTNNFTIPNFDSRMW